MEWLKTVTELRGSVEKSSLARARQINESGFYVIEKQNDEVLTVENCLILHIPKSDEFPGKKAKYHLRVISEVDVVKFSLLFLKM